MAPYEYLGAGVLAATREAAWLKALLSGVPDGVEVPAALATVACRRHLEEPEVPVREHVFLVGGTSEIMVATAAFDLVADPGTATFTKFSAS